MKKITFTHILPYIIALLIFFLLSYIYFLPALEGKSLRQSDMVHYKGMSKEINEFKEKNNEETLWANNMFSGMPTFLTTNQSKGNLLRIFNFILKIQNRPYNFLFVAFIGAFIGLLLFKVNPWLSIVGAIAYAMSSYFFNIIEAGHTSKTYALGFMPAIIGAIWYTFNGKVLLGSMLTGLFLGLQILSNHLQITYYTIIIVLFFGVFYLFDAIKTKTWPHFLKAIGVLILVVLLAAGSNLNRLWTTAEYGKYSIRGPSELTSNAKIRTESGLDRDYITAWSIGKMETLSILIPRINGGSSSETFGNDSEIFKELKRRGVPKAKQFAGSIPLYWGPQTFTTPVYFGAIIIFFFVFGLFIIRGPLKWWLFSVTVLSILLAWGRHFAPLTDFFIDNIPGYNKFRTVSMTLVIAGFTMPFIGILALREVINGTINKSDFLKAFKWSLGIVGGICFVFIALPGMFLDFKASFDAQLVSGGWPDELIDVIKDDRKKMVVNDALRSLFFVAAGSGLLIAYYFKKLKLNYFYILLGTLILIDLWTIDKRVLSEDDFVRPKEVKEPYTPNQANLQIMQDNNPYFRVYNTTLDPFRDASTSYFHFSIGGYHGAKIRRYQDLIENHLSKGNMKVLNMLNTKYFIVRGNQNNSEARINPGALGNAWFVDTLIVVSGADAEIEALNNFDPATEAIVDESFSEYYEGFEFNRLNGKRSISLQSYAPNELIYNSSAENDQMAVFSEIYYPKGWQAFIDGQEHEHFRVNYVLRAMIIPAGDHEIEFHFKPKSYYTGNKISLASSSILIILLLLTLLNELDIVQFRRNEK
ncbi:YfhO family protein [Bacteroidota bacterium]